MTDLLTISTILAAATDVSGVGDAVFTELRAFIAGGSSGIHHVCLGLCSLFCIISIAKTVADIMQDKEGGFGNVPIGKIFRPFLIMSLLIGYSSVITVLDKGVGYLGGGAQSAFGAPQKSTEKLKDGYEKAYDAYVQERDGSSDRPDPTKAEGVFVTKWVNQLTSWFERQIYDTKTKIVGVWKGIMGFCFELPGFIAEWCFALVLFIMMTVANIQLTVMATYGQIALAFSVLTPWKSAFTGFIGKYITVSLWKPILSIIASMAYAVTPSIGGVFAGGGDFLGRLAAAIMGCAVYIAAIHMAFNVGSIASDVYNLGSAGSAAGSAGGAMGKKMKLT